MGLLESSEPELSTEGGSLVGLPVAVGAAAGEDASLGEGVAALSLLPPFWGGLAELEGMD
jgi:hypothetical protein